MRFDVLEPPRTCDKTLHNLLSLITYRKYQAKTKTQRMRTSFYAFGSPSLATNGPRISKVMCVNLTICMYVIIQKLQEVKDDHG